MHLNGRIYDPYVGKFLSADPHVTDPVNGQNYNRYSYVLNNPTNLTDPTGFDAEEKKAAPPPDKKPGGCDTDCLKKAYKEGKTFVVVDDDGTVVEIAAVGQDGRYQVFTAGGRQDSKNGGGAGVASGRGDPRELSPTSIAEPNPPNGYALDGSYYGPRGAESKEERRFMIGSKEFVIIGGTVEQQKQAETALRQIFKTKKGMEGLGILEARRSWFGWGGPTEFTIDFRASSLILNDAHVDSLKGNTILQDPYYRPCVLTDHGWEYLDMRRVMYHELGHAIWGYDDQPYPKRMENIDKAENVFAKEFGESKRIRYAPYHQSPQ